MVPMEQTGRTQKGTDEDRGRGRKAEVISRIGEAG